MNSRDIDVLEHIIGYCNEIKDARERFGDTLEAMRADKHYRNSVSMCILQIGELVTHLSDDFKAAYTEMSWQDITRMRHIAAHHYTKFDTNILYKTVAERIPELREYCESILSQYAVLEQKALPEQDEVSPSKTQSADDFGSLES